MEEMVECDKQYSLPTANEQAPSEHVSITSNINKHKLYDNWTLWAHLPHDIDWSLSSYKKIMTFGTIEDTLALYQHLPNQMIKNCMLFLMRKGVHPTWEDKRNRNGGSFSYKISNKDVIPTWKQLSYTLVGETLSTNKTLMKDITGITISPKKNFCIIKIWVSNCKSQNPSHISTIAGISSHGCIFKRHQPKY